MQTERDFRGISRVQNDVTLPLYSKSEGAAHYFLIFSSKPLQRFSWMLYACNFRILQRKKLIVKNCFQGKGVNQPLTELLNSTDQLKEKT